MKLSEGDFLDIFEGVPQGEFAKTEIEAGVGIIELLVKSGFLSSNGEARRALQENSISINKNKVTLETTVGADQLLKGKYLLLQRGKKNYFVVKTA
jgi:tyrosyl-tRNA synthetase